MMEKVTVRMLPEINKEAKIVIHDIAAVAIKNGWESLAFAENDECFAEVYIDNMTFHLTTRGDVRLYSEEAGDGTQVILTNKNGDELRELVEKKGLNNYIIENNNWFELLIVASDDDGYTEGIVFEAVPTTIAELEDTLISYAVHQYKYDAGISA